MTLHNGGREMPGTRGNKSATSRVCWRASVISRCLDVVISFGIIDKLLRRYVALLVQNLRAFPALSCGQTENYKTWCEEGRLKYLNFTTIAVWGMYHRSDTLRSLYLSCDT